MGSSNPPFMYKYYTRRLPSTLLFPSRSYSLLAQLSAAASSICIHIAAKYFLVFPFSSDHKMVQGMVATSPPPSLMRSQVRSSASTPLVCQTILQLYSPAVDLWCLTTSTQLLDQQAHRHWPSTSADSTLTASAPCIQSSPLQ